MGRSAPPSMQHPVAQSGHDSITILIGMPLIATLLLNPFALAEDSSLRSEEQVAEDARAVWESGAINPAIEILDQGIQDYPDALTL